MIQYTKHHNTLNAVYVDTSNSDDILLMQPIPQTKRQARILPKMTGIRHFQPIERIGENLKVRCWCGDIIEVNYSNFSDESIDGMQARLQRWCDTHGECPAPEPEATA